MDLDFGDTSFLGDLHCFGTVFPEEALGPPLPVSALSGSSLPSC